MFIQRSTTFALFFATVAVISSISGVESTMGCTEIGGTEAMAQNLCFLTPGYAKCTSTVGGTSRSFYACCPAGATTTYTPGDVCGGSISKSSSNETAVIDAADVGASDTIESSASSSVAIASITVVAAATAATIFGF